MTDTLSGTVTNKAGQPFLEGNLFPMPHEATVDECRVTGQVPAALNGDFLRNGPNPMFEPTGRYHMFDGDGMLVGFHFDEGRVSYKNRWIHSKALDAEIRLGRNVYPGLADMMNFPSEELVGDAGPVKNPANTHIVRHAGKTLALWEGGLPTEVTSNLDTVGEWDFNGKLAGAMTAHPRLDPRTGEMFFFGYQPFPPFIRYYVVDASGALVHSTDIDLPAPVMMHDFVITEDHAIFLDSPVCFNMSGDGGEMVRWQPENGCRLGVLPRRGDGSEIRWFEIEPGHVQHFWNAWVDGDRIELSGSRLTHVDFGMQSGDDNLTDSSANAEAGHPARYWIDLAAGEAGWEQFDDMGGDFCRFNETMTGVKTRYDYMCGFSGSNDVMGDFDAVVKYDAVTGAKTQWQSGAHGHVGEAVFAPDPDGTGEDDGWLLTLVWNDSTDGTDLCVIDARDVAAGPVARIHAPERVSFGFHANWFPDA